MYEQHHQTRHPVYTSWRAMRSRCLSTSDEHFPDYGGRGITICPEWDSFPVFLDWALTNGWAPGLTIDRKNNDGPYTPGNCRWTNAKGQAEHKRPQRVSKHHVMVEHDGRARNMRQWAAETGIGYTTLMKRYLAGRRGAELFAATDARKAHPRPA